MSWLKRVRERAHELVRRDAESRMEQEMGFHLEMEAERLAREEGLEADEAGRRARVAFGGHDRYREEMRDGRRLAWLSGLRLDLKLGARMLMKYPVITLASVLALSVAVTLAASWFEFMTDLVAPRLPIPGGDRIVAVRNQDLASGGVEPRSLRDFERWREEVRSIEHLSAAAAIEVEVSTEDGRVLTLEGMRVTASLFRLAGVPPLLGRAPAEADDALGAPLVAVLAYDAWQRLFDGDRSAIGRAVRVGSEPATVVGVMPEGFGFPLNEEIWLPLRESASWYGEREGPAISVAGRLAAGVGLERAQAELESIGLRAAAQFPGTHDRLRPHVRRYPQAGEMVVPAVGLNIPLLLFLIVVSANVATLLFARTATRAGEIALRSALGASRRRIILQLIAEALVLTSVAAALGLAAAHALLRWGMDLFWQVQEMNPPFWWDPGLSATTGLYVAALAVLGAVIIGAIPGVRATRRQLRQRLAQPGSGGSGMKFGTLATGVIVLQVALCVAFIPVAVTRGQDLLADTRATEFPADAFLSGRLTRQADLQSARLGEDSAGAELFDEVQRRLAAEPGVLAATRASRLPGFNHPARTVEVEGDTALVRARTVAVDPAFFEIAGARIVAGRAFRNEDVTGSADVAIVEQAWVREAFGERNAVGQRIRYASRGEEPASPWYQIVGVVSGIERAIGPGERVALFHPLRPHEHASVQLYLRTARRADALAPRVHDLVASVHSGLRVAELRPLNETWRPVQRANVAFMGGLGVVAAVIVLFALIGIYALMSFTVAQRAREIGIRAALGANPRRLIVSIFSRAIMQIGLGVALGALLVSLTVLRSPDGLRLVGAVAAAMIGVGLIGCATPARRALRIQPIDALRAE